MKEPFIWDRFSDQPYPIKNRAYKKAMRKKNAFSYIPLLLTNLIFFPISLILMPFLKGQKKPKIEDFFGMGVDLDKGKEQVELINELGVKHLLIRMPLWQIDRIDDYVEFAKSFGSDKEILINILQDREYIENKELLLKDIDTIFAKFSPFVKEFQIGNAINRTKWGFFSVDEYLKWYEQIQTIRDSKYPNIKLVGSSIIDFEYHYTIRSLFNFFKVKYDVFSSLLYVDRRGAPQNRQYGFFDTKKKIDLLYSMVYLSPKSSNKIYITEVNWPLSNTAPYAPTSEKECVSEESYAKFMQDYYKIALKSGKVDRVYWHQLIAPGYGLVDNREGIRKMPAFYKFKNMIEIIELKLEN